MEELMQDVAKPLSLEEIVARGGYENKESKWKKAKITFMGTTYDGIRDDKGFFYGPDSTLYHTETQDYADGKLFTGLSYELYSTGELKSYQVYEASEAVETYSFYKNGNPQTYYSSRKEEKAILLKFGIDGSLIEKKR